jgi:transposase-like protein
MFSAGGGGDVAALWAALCACPVAEHAHSVRNAKTRLAWVRLYEETGDAGIMYRRRGISRPTLRKWWRRYQALDQAGLVVRSSGPLRPVARKVCAHTEALILRTRHLGAKRLRNELIRQHGLACRWIPSIACLFDTASGILTKHVSAAKEPGTIRVPSQGTVQMDVWKIVAGIYQHTAIDDCSSYKVLGVYPRRNAKNTEFP